MKKYIVISCLIVFVALAAMGAKLTTVISPYQTLVVSAAGAESILATGATTDFNPGLPNPGTAALNPRDLSSILWSNSTGETNANGVILTCFATASANNTCEMALYGIADGGGAPERIADIIWIFGTARHTSTTILWADTCTVTSDHHTGNGGSGLAAADNGNNMIAKLRFDTTGYRYIYAIAHGTATGAATNITVIMRPY